MKMLKNKIYMILSITVLTIYLALFGLLMAVITLLMSSYSILEKITK